MSATFTSQVIEHEIGASGELVLKLVEGTVRIRGTDGTRARVVIDAPGLEDRIGVDRLDGALHVRVPDRFMSVGWLGFDLHALTTPHRSVEIEVEVPRMASVSIDGASTKVRADGLLGDQRIHLVSGDVRLTSGGGKIGVDGVSGRVTVDAIAPVALGVRTVSGDVQVAAPSISELRVSSMSANVDASGALVGSGPYRIETVSGRCVISTDSAVRVESHTVAGSVSSERSGEHVSAGSGRTYVFGAGGPTISFNSMSGSLRIRPLGAPSQPSAATQPPPPPEAASTDTASGFSAGISAEPAPGWGSPAAPAGTATAQKQPEWSGSQLVGDMVPREAPAANGMGGVDAASATDPREGRIAILRALERGEIDVDEAGRRLETLDEHRA